MKTLLYLVLPILQHATTDPYLHCRPLDTHRQVWVYILWGHCSFLLGPGPHNILSMPSKSVFPQSCVSSGGSMMGLMAAVSKWAYAIPRSTAPRAPTSAAGHFLPIPPQETLRHSSVSVSGGLWVLLHTSYVWASEPLWQVWDLILNVVCTLLPACWGFFFALGHGISPQNLSGAMQPLLQHLPSCWMFHGYTQKS